MSIDTQLEKLKVAVLMHTRTKDLDPYCTMVYLNLYLQLYPCQPPTAHPLRQDVTLTIFLVRAFARNGRLGATRLTKTASFWTHS